MKKEKEQNTLDNTQTSMLSARPYYFPAAWERALGDKLIDPNRPQAGQGK